MFENIDTYYDEIKTINIEEIICYHAKKIGIYKYIVKVPEKEFCINKF
jgi:hypothetical protein